MIDPTLPRRVAALEEHLARLEELLRIEAVPPLMLERTAGAGLVLALSERGGLTVESPDATILFADVDTLLINQESISDPEPGLVPRVVQLHDASLTTGGLVTKDLQNFRGIKRFYAGASTDGPFVELAAEGTGGGVEPLSGRNVVAWCADNTGGNLIELFDDVPNATLYLYAEIGAHRQNARYGVVDADNVPWPGAYGLMTVTISGVVYPVQIGGLDVASRGGLNTVATGSGSGGGGGGSITITGLGTASNASAINTFTKTGVTVPGGSVLRLSLATINASNPGDIPAVALAGTPLTQLLGTSVNGAANGLWVYELFFSSTTTGSLVASLPAGHTASWMLSALEISGLAFNSVNNFNVASGTTAPSVTDSPLSAIPEAHIATFLLQRAGSAPVVGSWSGAPAYASLGQDVTITVGGNVWTMSDGDLIANATSVTASLSGSTQDNWGGAADDYK